MLLAVAGLWIAYLVPHRLRSRQELLESRAEDRFSEGLRVLRVAHAAGATGPVTGRAAHRPAASGQVLIHPGGRRGGGGHMNRPHAARDRAVADAVRTTAAQHAQRAAYLARRRAAARRRAVLTLVLLVASAVAWGAVALASAPALAGLVPTGTLAGVLVLGRRAVVAAARADAAWAAGAADRVPLPGTHAAGRVTGRAVHPSDADTEVIARVRTSAPRATGVVGADDTAERVAQARADAVRAATTARQRDEAAQPADAAAGTTATDTGTPAAHEPAPAVEDEPTWVPVPVPPPTYTLKPSAPRREPAPLPADGLVTSSAAAPADATTATDDATTTADADERTPGASSAEQGTTSAAPLDLDAILARRRAVGE